MKTMLKKVPNKLYIIFCIISSFFVMFHTLIILVHSIFADFDVQILLFIVFSVFMIASFWLLGFIRISIQVKILIFTALFFLLLNYINISSKIPTISKILDKDICLDTGICKEGLEVNTNHGLVTINKENCIKYNWLWNEEKRYCNVEPE